MTMTLIVAMDRFNRLICWLIAVGLLFMVVLVSLQICVRFLLPMLGMPAGLPWTEEASRYLMVWVIFLGGAIAARRGSLIAVTALVDALPPRRASQLGAFAFGGLVAIFAAMSWYGWQWAQFGADEISPALAVSKFWLYLAMPVGCLLASVNTVILLIEQLSPDRAARNKTASFEASSAPVAGGGPVESGDISAQMTASR